MRAGRLRRRVTIQEKTVSRNSYGEEIITWSDVDTVWAAVEPLHGREYTEMRRAGAEVTTRIIMRYRDDVTPAMRITWDSHVYDIESVIDVDGRHVQLELMCREVLNA